MKLILYCLLLLNTVNCFSQHTVWLETELFDKKGGWSIDAQFVDQMGSPYLLAHGLGNPVENAVTPVSFPAKGVYHLWVRTKDWIPGRKGPGSFRILLNEQPISQVFGSDGIVDWHWAYGGTVTVDKKEYTIALNDLSGFAGRCDAIVFTQEKGMKLPDANIALDKLRTKHLALREVPIQEGTFDLVIAGGGVAGICSAVQAARLGLKVALINNRPVLGGVSSSEGGVSTDGDTFRNKYPALGRIVREIDNHNAGIGGPAYLYRDNDRKDVVLNEKNITLFENMHVSGADVSNGTITGIYATNLHSLEKHYFKGSFFADCTGDASLGRLAGADHHYGRESKSETQEPSAPDVADNLVMGSSNQWDSQLESEVSSFPIKEWMLQFSEDYHFELTRSVWNWETGFNNLHTVNDAEAIRDHNMRAIYSNWAYLKTNKSDKYGKYRLSRLSPISGKRESYRLMGDFILTEQDIVNKKEYPDAIVTSTWGIDLHYPDKENSRRFPGQEFIGYAEHALKQQDVYTFPYRCLYSRNIGNLFMAGRNISVSHIALGAVRVQRCTGMMGEVVGIAAFLCKKNQCLPRDIYTLHLQQLINHVSKPCIP